MKATVVHTAIVLLATASAAFAQWGYYPDNRASTPGESHARGMADVVRSQGVYNLTTSQAAINMTEAQSRYIDNRDQWTNTYFQMRDANRKYRAAERGPRPSMENLVRYAQAGKPKQLSPSELDVITGGVSWPKLLQTEPFSESRKQVEQLFAKRAEGVALGFKDQTELGKITDAMLADLKKLLREKEVSQMDYIACKRFVESLAYQGRLPAS